MSASPQASEPLQIGLVLFPKVTQLDFTAMLDFHRSHAAEMTVGVRPFEVQVPYGVVRTDGVRVPPEAADFDATHDLDDPVDQAE